MNIELISSHEGIAAGDRVTYEIRGLEPREGGIYIVHWIIEPPGRLTPTGEDVGLVGDDIYSVFSAEESAGPARATFEVEEPGPPVAVTVDVRYRTQQFSLR